MDDGVTSFACMFPEYYSDKEIEDILWNELFIGLRIKRCKDYAKITINRTPQHDPGSTHDVGENTIFARIEVEFKKQEEVNARNPQ